MDIDGLKPNYELCVNSVYIDTYSKNLLIITDVIFHPDKIQRNRITKEWVILYSSGYQTIYSSDAMFNLILWKKIEKLS